MRVSNTTDPNHVLNRARKDTMTATNASGQSAAKPRFSHLDPGVKDVAHVKAFYTGTLRLTVTDRGTAGGMKLVFQSRDPMNQHQIVLATGRRHFEGR